MSDKTVTVGLKIDGDASGARAALRDTDKDLQGLNATGQKTATVAAGVDQMGDAATRSAQKAAPAKRRIRDGLKSIGDQLTEVKLLYAGWLSAQAAAAGASGLAKTADEWANLRSRIKLAVGEGAAFQTAFQGIQDVALRTNSSLENTGNLFVRLAEAGKQIGIGQAEALRLTETVNQAVQLSIGRAHV